MKTEKYIQRKKIRNLLLYAVILAAAFYTMLKGNDLYDVFQSYRKMKYIYLFPAMITALFFVSSEGMMMWYLFRILGEKAEFIRCIVYSFIGFMYSSITPSASGGQPMQLYYMKKDGNSLSSSTIILMIVALSYKLTLCIIGVCLIIFWKQPLYNYLGSYMTLYYIGLLLNVGVVTGITIIMVSPNIAKILIEKCESILIKIYILKKSEERKNKINKYIDDYKDGVIFLMNHKFHMINILIITFIQRICPYIVTYLVYLGFSLKGTDVITILCLQASVYTAVDMMPLPGAQGITELMYKHVFALVFNGAYLSASLLAVRGLNYYLLLIISIIITFAFGLNKSKPKAD